MSEIQVQHTSVTFRVTARVDEKDEVCVVGSTPELGGWQFAAAVPLVLSDAALSTWSCDLSLPSSATAAYIYIVRRGRTLRKRESFGPHRHVTPFGAEMLVDDSDFGVLFTGDQRKERADGGWLCDDTQLRVSLGYTHLDGSFTEGVKIYDETAAYTADFRAASAFAVPTDFEQWTAFNKQPDVDTFVFNAPTRDHLSFHIDVEVRPGGGMNGGSSDAPDAARPTRGRVYVHHRELLETKGELRRTILDTELRPIGEATLQYLVVAPMPHPLNDLRHSWSSFRVERSPVVVGHRGSGATNDPHTSHTLTENTLLSFLAAAQDGAEYIEFDVQLSKDGVPVIVHDEEIFLKTVGSDGQELRQKVPVNKVLIDKFRQLQPLMPKKDHERQLQESDLGGSGDKPRGEPQSLHASPRIRAKSAMLRRSSQDNYQARLGNFPSLEELFEYLPAELGFNVEIKYPFSLKYERFVGIKERNEYVDTILKVMMERAEERKCYISSFDPDVCLMASLKQSRFPVFLLTTGGRVAFRNPVKNSLEAAVDFARKANLCGVVSEAVAVMENSHLVTAAHNAGLLLFTYGGSNKDPSLVRLQAAQGVDGIITDTITTILPAARAAVVVPRPARLESDASTGVFSFGGSKKLIQETKAKRTEDDLLHDITSELTKH